MMVRRIWVRSAALLRTGLALASILLLLAVACPAGAWAQQVGNRSNLDADGNPRSDVIPSDNSDMDDLLAKAQAISAFAAQCLGMECPVLDCEAAGFFQDNLDKAEDFLKHMIRWLGKANDAHFDHFKNLHSQGTLSSERLAQLQELLAWQEYVMGIANTLLDIADIADIIDHYRKNPGELNPENFETLVNHVWRMDKLIKKVESGATNVASGLSGGDSIPKAYASLTPGAGGLSGGDLNTLKGYTGEALGIINNTRKGLKAGEKLWDAFNKPGGARANLLSALGSAVSAWGASDMAARAARAQQLQLDLGSEDMAATNAFEARRKVLIRLGKAEAALAAIQAANKALQACMTKAECPLRSKTRTGNTLPDFIMIAPNGQQIESWGWALQAIKIQLDDVRARLGPPMPDLEDDCDEDDTAYLIGGDATGTFVRIGTDSPLWCTYQEGNPTSVPLTPLDEDDGDDPRDVQPPGGGGPNDGGDDDDGDDPRDAGGPSDDDDDDGDDPRDVGGPCQDELALLRSFMRDHGDRLRAEAADTSQSIEQQAQASHDLTEITNRLEKLEKECPPEDDGDDPRDAGGPADDDDGDDPRDAGGPDDDDDGDDPRDAQPPTIVIIVKARTSLLAAPDLAQESAGLQIKLFAPSVIDVALPGPGVAKPQTDHAADPVQGTLGGGGDLRLDVPIEMVQLSLTGTAVIGGQLFEVKVDPVTQTSRNVLIGGLTPTPYIAGMPPGLQVLVSDSGVINGLGFVTLTYPLYLDTLVNRYLIYLPGGIVVEVNYCREKLAGPNDPLFQGNKAWGQAHDNQWAIKQVGLTGDDTSAWNLLGDDPKPVTVAVIDTGLDWNHLDFSWDNLWRNQGEVPDNGIDDDDNGYVDDVIGWNFYGHDNNPWDHDGHGTFIAGVIAATQNNETGIAGINRHARIMVLKALNSFGHSRGSYLAKAIAYAVDNGARIINLSVGGKNLTRLEEQAVKYAHSKGVLIVAASGNDGIDVSGFGMAGLDGVLTVAATGLKGTREKFSNWGANVGIAAPGIDVLSLRARRTDTMRDIPEVAYTAGDGYVGDDKRYYRAGGTSFSAPIVTGIASLLMSQRPELTGPQVARILKQTAKDIGVPGPDQFSGYGIVDARAALAARPEFYVLAHISGVEIKQKPGGTVVQVFGQADADDFDTAELSIGAGKTPTTWKRIGAIGQTAETGLLGEIPADDLRGAAVWVLRVVTRHKDGTAREYRYQLSLG